MTLFRSKTLFSRWFGRLCLDDCLAQPHDFGIAYTEWRLCAETRFRLGWFSRFHRRTFEKYVLTVVVAAKRQLVRSGKKQSREAEYDRLTASPGVVPDGGQCPVRG
jgi:hypothetical protein